MADIHPFLLHMMEHLMQRFDNATNVTSGSADWVMYLPESTVIFEWKHNETRIILASGDGWRLAIDLFLQNPNTVRVSLEADAGCPRAAFEHTRTFRCQRRFEAFVDGELAALVSSQ